MPVRGRILSASLSQSRKFSRLENNDHRLMYVMLIPHVDCEGRHDAEAAILAGKCYTSLGFTPEQIMVGLGDMANVGLIHLYEVNGDMFLEVDDFLEHQIIRRKANGDPVREAPSRIPSRHDRGGAAGSSASVLPQNSGGGASGEPENEEPQSQTEGRTTDAVVTQNCRTSDAELTSQSKAKQSKGETLTGSLPTVSANGAPRPKGRGPAPAVADYVARKAPREKTEAELELERFAQRAEA